jgi:hypothetical protein
VTPKVRSLFRDHLSDGQCPDGLAPAELPLALSLGATMHYTAEGQAAVLKDRGRSRLHERDAGKLPMTVPRNVSN